MNAIEVVARAIHFEDCTTPECDLKATSTDRRLAHAAIAALAAQGDIAGVKCPECESPDYPWITGPVGRGRYCDNAWHEIDDKTRALLARQAAVHATQVAELEARPNYRVVQPVNDAVTQANDRAEAAEATVERVRAVCDEPESWLTHTLESGPDCVRVSEIRAALGDGGETDGNTTT
jgi:formate-dependent nitrite reductase cytochrome c552 subunit